MKIFFFVQYTLKRLFSYVLELYGSVEIVTGATYDDFRGLFYHIFEFFFCFVVAICYLVHDVETIFHLSYVLTASGNLF